MVNAESNKSELRGITVIALFFWVLSVVLVAWKWKVLPPEVPLLYSLPDGEAQIARKEGLAILVAGALAATIMNTILAKIAVKKDRLVAQFVLWTGVVVNAMVFVTVFKIVTLITG